MVDPYSMGEVGLMTAAVCGRNLLKGICKRNGRRFKAHQD